MHGAVRDLMIDFVTKQLASLNSLQLWRLKSSRDLGCSEHL